MASNNKNSGKIPSGFAEWAFENIQERKRKRDIVLGGGSDRDKFDNLNGGQFRPEYIREVEQTRKDIQNHNFQLSDGLSGWLDDAYRNQHRERQEQSRRIGEQMFPPKRKELSELNQDLHDQGEMRNYYLRDRSGKAHARDLMFPEDETEKRRSQIESNRHPMDELMRKQLKDRENERKRSV